MAGTDWTPFILIGAGVFGYVQGSAGKLPAGLQAIYDKYVGSSNTPAPGTPPPGPGVPAACSAVLVTAWAVPGGGPKGILGDAAPYNLSIAIGTAFCVANGHLPNSMDEFNQWGTSSGHKHPDGGWS